MTEFEGVVPALQQALSKRGYTVLTPVQEAVLAPELRDVDALVSAQTGSGKTVAFGLNIAPTLLEGADRLPYAKAPLALVVAPTRELALQVKRELEWLYEMTGAIIASCVGGMDMRTERRTLERGAHIVVGTPGRLGDHIERGSFNTKGLKAVVLDEADEMLDLGFRDELEFILDAAPKDRRTLMFSATVPRSIATMAKRYQRDAVRVTTTEERSQHVDIEYRALSVAPNDRENAIINVLRYFEAESAIVFCATRATVNHMTSRFTNRGFSVVALSGELSQSQRTHALQAMRDGRARVCIATDVAARGIDLPNLELVIHADIPKNPDILKHRSGRTGRAGRKGVSALIVPYNARRRTERILQSANIEAIWAKPPSVEDILIRDNARMLADPTLIEPIKEDEQAFAQELLASHSAEQLAAAFVRLYRGKQSSPEELLDAAPERSERPDRKEKRRDDFKNGVWFSVSVGHKHNAEPRWLLPMLCRAGHLTKTDIGAIKIQQEETYVELEPGCVDKFLEAIGPSRKMEKTVEVVRLDGIPDLSRGARDKSYGRKKPYSDRKSGDDRPRKEKSWDKPRREKPREEKSWKKPREEKSQEKSQEKPQEKPQEKYQPKAWDKPAGDQSKPKKPHKKKLARAAALAAKKGGKPSRKASPAHSGAAQPGSSPLKRRKPSAKN